VKVAIPSKLVYAIPERPTFWFSWLVVETTAAVLSQLIQTGTLASPYFFAEVVESSTTTVIWKLEPIAKLLAAPRLVFTWTDGLVGDVRVIVAVATAAAVGPSTAGAVAALLAPTAKPDVTPMFDVQ